MSVSALRVQFKVVGADLVGWYKAVVLLLDNFNVVTLKRELEQRDGLVRHELRGNGTAGEARKLLTTAGYILAGLSNAEPVGPTLGLNGYYKLLAVPVQPHINLVDLDLSHILNEGLQMIL